MLCLRTRFWMKLDFEGGCLDGRPVHRGLRWNWGRVAWLVLSCRIFFGHDEVGLAAGAFAGAASVLFFDPDAASLGAGDEECIFVLLFFADLLEISFFLCGDLQEFVRCRSINFLLRHRRFFAADGGLQKLVLNRRLFKLIKTLRPR